MTGKPLFAAVLGCISLAANADCSFGDLTTMSRTSLGVSKCVKTAKNVINNGNETAVSILKNDFGISTATGSWIEKLENLSGKTTIDFNTPLSGTTIVALHFGGASEVGNSTVFYQFNAGSSLDSFMTTLSASSNAAVYVTGVVPEPETYAMFLTGVGLMGAIVRRRKHDQS